MSRPSASLVAYAPSDHPFNAQNARKELSLLRTKFDGLILYQSDSELYPLLSIATDLHFRAALVLVHDPTSEPQLAEAAALVRKFAGSMALAVCVGSEGIMEHRYSLAEVEAGAARLNSLLAPLRVNLTTAEPWWRYLNDRPDAAGLRSFGDFISLHIHPVWDADIRDGAEAADWSYARAMQVLGLAPRALLVRETGFPGAGTAPRAALSGVEFTRASQAAFWRRWQQLRHQQSKPFPSLAAVFEAIDNPAKVNPAKPSTNFEGSWGLLAHGSLAPYPAWEVFPTLPTPAAQH